MERVSMEWHRGQQTLDEFIEACGVAAQATGHTVTPSMKLHMIMAAGAGVTINFEPLPRPTRPKPPRRPLTVGEWKLQEERRWSAALRKATTQRVCVKPLSSA